MKTVYRSRNFQRVHGVNRQLDKTKIVVHEGNEINTQEKKVGLDEEFTSGGCDVCVRV